MLVETCSKEFAISLFGMRRMRTSRLRYVRNLNFGHVEGRYNKLIAVPQFSYTKYQFVNGRARVLWNLSGYGSVLHHSLGPRCWVGAVRDIIFWVSRIQGAKALMLCSLDEAEKWVRGALKFDITWLPAVLSLTVCRLTGLNSRVPGHGIRIVLYAL